jgi:hypothetical protein
MAIFSRTNVTARDADGQPVVTTFRREANADRDIDELIGICRGIICDGNVNDAEARWMLGWLDVHAECAELWPARVLIPRLHRALANGVLDDEEERDLLALIQSTVGGNAVAQAQSSMSTSLPLTEPAPAIEFPAHSFCFTGKFVAGSRAWCESQVTDRGGTICGVTKELGYLVIGDVGSRDWIHSTYGRKIEKAISYAERGVPLAIVGEEHWHSSLT